MRKREKDLQYLPMEVPKNPLDVYMQLLYTHEIPRSLA